MSVTASNLVLGPANLYFGVVGAVEPTDALAVPASGIWTPVGATQNGVSLTVKQAWTQLDVDQIVDIPESRIKSRSLVIATDLAELTLANLTLALNGGTTATAAQTATYTPDSGNSANTPKYSALLIDGIAPNGKTRRIIVRKALSTKDVAFKYEASKQSVYGVEFTAHWVSAGTTPFVIMDAQ